MIDIFLVILGIFLFGITIFFAWIGWGTFFYGVPLVPTSSHIAKKMIDIANIQKNKKVYDLGCGTGTILFQLPKNVIGYGYDLVFPAIWYAKLKNLFLRKNIFFERADFFQKKLHDADIIFCYLFRSVMDRFYREKWNELSKGCWIISHGFPIRALNPKKIIRIGKAKIFMYRK
jgi:SAM-dependent methyltransferase